MSLSARMADARDQHAVDLPGDVALEAANDLSLALALLCAPCYVLLGATISAHPSQTDHVQRTVGLAVATAVETMPDDLAGGGLDGRDTAEAGQGGLATQPLGIVFKATIKSVAAWSVPMPAKETNSGAACATSRSRCASSSAISSERESLVTASHRTESELGRRRYVAKVISDAEACGHRDELLRRESAQTVEEFVRCCHA
jgi:hypothetical protein